MTSIPERDQEERRDRLARRLLHASEGGLAAAVCGLGCELSGFSAKLSQGDCLLTVRANFEGRDMVCFVGAETLAGAVLKVTREAKNNGLRWKKDRWAE